MPKTYADILFEKAMTIVGATTKTGIDRKKAERIEDPKGFFKDAKAPNLNESESGLLPCPFCGSEPTRENDEGGDHIACPNWECVQPQITTPPGEDASLLWNMRA